MNEYEISELCILVGFACEAALGTIDVDVPILTTAQWRRMRELTWMLLDIDAE